MHSGIRASKHIEFLLKLEMASNVTPWYARVPTPSNVADSPSWGDTKQLIDQGIPAVDPITGLSDIFVILVERSVKWGMSDLRGAT